MDVCRLAVPDAPALRALRIASLTESPSAFGSSLEDEAALPIAAFETRLMAAEGNAYFGVHQAGELVGCVRVTRAEGEKERHRAAIGSMFVVPRARRHGLACRLLDATIVHARGWPGVVQVELAVTATNAPAVSLYRRFGFVEFGRTPRALFVEGAYHDELLMALQL